MNWNQVGLGHSLSPALQVVCLFSPKNPSGSSDIFILDLCNNFDLSSARKNLAGTGLNPVESFSGFLSAIKKLQSTCELLCITLTQDTTSKCTLFHRLQWWISHTLLKQLIEGNRAILSLLVCSSLWALPDTMAVFFISHITLTSLSIPLRRTLTVWVASSYWISVTAL